MLSACTEARPAITDTVPIADSTLVPSTEATDSDPARAALLAYARNPRVLLSEAGTAAEEVRSARMHFYRQERLGLFDRLRPIERIEALYRADPHSVYFRWLDEDTSLSECAYVADRNNGKVLLKNRKGLFGGPGSVTALAPELAVTFKQAKMPITEFGPREVSAAVDRSHRGCRGDGRGIRTTRRYAHRRTGKRVLLPLAIAFSNRRSISR